MRAIEATATPAFDPKGTFALARKASPGTLRRAALHDISGALAEWQMGKGTVTATPCHRNPLSP